VTERGTESVAHFDPDTFLVEPCSMPAIKKTRSSFRTKTVAMSYVNKYVGEWTWLDFLTYFNDECEDKLGLRNPGISRAHYGKWKGTIEPSIEQWGPIMFKSMIDWAIDHRDDFPQWKTFTMSLVCGNHGWVQTIAQGAQQEGKTNDKWEELLG
jgi:hypothetical protein